MISTHHHTTKKKANDNATMKFFYSLDRGVLEMDTFRLE